MGLSRATIRLVTVVSLGVMVLIAAAWCRSGEYDEYYSIFLIAGQPRPDWPTGPFTVAVAQKFYHGHASFGQIARDLRHGDVHPPLYFWLLALWRDTFGTALFRLRLLSVLCTMCSLCLVACIARRIGAAPALAVTITLLSYGFAYTGIIARDFALAGAFSLAGVLLLIEAERISKPAWAFAGGIALGAACFTNYLACFTTIAFLGWIATVGWRRKSVWLSSWFGAALFIPAGLWFFLAQKGTRKGQFMPFHLPHALVLLARDQAGAILGALPRYVPSPWSHIVEAALALLLAYFVILIVIRGLPCITDRYRTLVIAGIIAPPLGLFALGIGFDTTPVEMRYLWLGLPYIGLALATALKDRRRTTAFLLAVQSAAIIGLAIAPQTMQPGARTAHAAAKLGTPATLVLIPFGNDGVGIPGPFIAALPHTTHIMVVRASNQAMLHEVGRYHRVAIARIEVDNTSRALVPALDTLFKTAPCWQSGSARRDIAVFTNLCRNRHG